jgi:ubiquinone/menaquinone biosynthesis C-methylase UbiE
MRAKGTLRRLYEAIWGRVVALTYDSFLAATEKAGLTDRRRALLTDAHGRCLEIGAGTGVNLDLWPDAVDAIVLSEPDRHMVGRLRRRAERSKRLVEIVEAPGERLPFDDGSFDTVAMTLVLCTAPDPSAVLREVRRVLKPRHHRGVGLKVEQVDRGKISKASPIVGPMIVGVARELGA